MKIHERLRFYRLNHGLILKFVAKKADMSIQRLSAIERGSIKLSADEFESICLNGYHINPSNFFMPTIADNETFNV